MRYLLVTIIAVIVIFVVGTVLIGKSTFEGLVVEKPYETGLQWDEARKRNEALGWTVAPDVRDFTTGRNRLGISIRDRDGKPLEGLQVVVHAARPSTVRYDLTQQAESEGAGRYRADIVLPVYGLWDLSIEAGKGTDLFTHRQRIFVAPPKDNSGADGAECRISMRPCSRTAGDMTVTFEILPRPVRTMKNLRFVIVLSEGNRPVIDADVSLDLTMPGMIMGSNRPAIRHAEGGRYEGSGVIIRCPSGRKLWKAAVQITRRGETVPAEFLFEVQ